MSLWWSVQAGKPNGHGAADHEYAAVFVDSPGHLSVPRAEAGAAHGIQSLAPVVEPGGRSTASGLTVAAGGSVLIPLRRFTSESSLVSGASGDSPEREGPLNTPVRARSAPSVPAGALARRLRVLLQPPPELLLARGGPITWPAPLFPYQREGIAALLAHNALLLADDMGLGKTIQAIGALRILITRRELDDALIVAPASLLSQWRQAIAHWAPELRVSLVRGPSTDRAWQWRAPAHIYLTSYETLREDCTENPDSPPRRRTWGAVVLDEAQKIKNRDTEVSRKVKQLHRQRAWALTGTPLENQEGDLASILEFVAPLGRGESPRKLYPGPALRAIHRQVQLRRRKRDVLPQLPPKLVTTVVIDLEGAQRESYVRAEREGILELKRRGQTVRVANVLELILRLKQICNFCPVTGQSSKLDDLQERLATLRAEGHGALVFSQFTDDIFGVRALESRLPEYNPVIFTGDLSLAQRDVAIATFKRAPAGRAMLLSVRSGGQGLNIQEASYVVHFDRWWNPAVERQAEDRSHRLGQEHPVHVYTYICAGTIEERIDEILQRKQALFNELVDEVSLDLTTRLSQAELFGLFGLAPPRTGEQ